MTTPTVLLVEDDEEIHELLKRYLEKESLHVISAHDGNTALARLQDTDCQLAVLDLMIPGADGYQVLGEIRRRGNLPVLIVSSKNDEVDKIVGLRMGADDYLTKPFGLGEFIARVRALLRRYLELGAPAPTRAVAELRHEGLILNTTTYEVTADGRVCALTPTEYEILKLLLGEPGKVFTKAEIFETVWKQDYLGDENTIMVHMRRLRAKIEPVPSHPQYVHTVWGVGYRVGSETK